MTVLGRWTSNVSHCSFIYELWKLLPTFSELQRTNQVFSYIHFLSLYLCEKLVMLHMQVEERRVQLKRRK